MKNTKLQWHPAFGAALRITLQEELEYLEMREEYLLSKKPLQMDILIIKKLKDVPIRKTIGRIFRKHNIIEYKSPGDSLSINDFYKVYGYACIYQSNTDQIKGIDPQAKKYRSMDLITRANWEQMEVEKKMCDALKELFAEELKEAGSKGRTEGIQTGIQTGIQQGKREMILAFLKAGAEINMIKEATGLNEEQIEEIRREIE